MNSEFPNESIEYAPLADVLASARQLGSLPMSNGVDGRDATQLAFDAPIDFPAIDAAVVPGDQIAVAVDPNLPGLVDVLTAILERFQSTDAEGVDVVLWEETPDELVRALRQELPSARSITKHASCDREQLRYLGADSQGEAVYVNRMIVDADFVLPLVCDRATAVVDTDPTCIFPLFTDSATQNRHQLSAAQPTVGNAEAGGPSIAWLLGICLRMVVVPNRDSGIESVRIEMLNGDGPTDVGAGDPVVESCCDLVVAVLDGAPWQQSWYNVVRALLGASQYVEPAGTIILWTGLREPANGQLALLDSFNLNESIEELEQNGSVSEDGEFPEWNVDAAMARAIAGMVADRRVILRSHLKDEVVEAMGWGAMRTTGELSQVASGFDTLGVLRSASFAAAAELIGF